MRSVLSPFQGPLKIKGTKESPNPSFPVTIWSQSPEGRVNSPARSWVGRRGQEEVQPPPRLPLPQRSPCLPQAEWAGPDPAEARGGVGFGPGSWRGGARRTSWEGRPSGRGSAPGGAGRGEWAGRVLLSASLRAAVSRLSPGARTSPRRRSSGESHSGLALWPLSFRRGERLRRSAEGGGALPRPPPRSPSPGEECATSCSPLASAAPRSKELGGRETKAAVGTDELETWVWANKRCERREGVKAMAAGEPRGLGFLGVAP